MWAVPHWELRKAGLDDLTGKVTFEICDSVSLYCVLGVFLYVLI